jgi:transcriptional regulator with XRE-family HTH domain
MPTPCIREAAGAAELARLTGLNISTTWRWLIGRTRPSKLALARLAERGVTLQLPPLQRPRKRRARP